MKLIFVTTNPEKLAEAQLALAPFGHQVEGKSFPFIEPTEGTLEEIARYKLEQIKEDEEIPIFVDDSGIFFESYPQFPGILTKRIFQLIGYKGIDKLLSGESRKAYFRGVIAVKWKGKIDVFHGITSGRIISEIPYNLPKDLRFPFDPIFIPDGDTQVLGNMSLEQRVYYSYRRKALEKMGHWLYSYQK
ncbi:non-canonical purine NTP pyrophosphatase [Tepidibacillus fermentans]|uniref:DITPase n=1 Tax=Tepidibacillus fermentans TaxID=1281767 RepID=A0A4R3KMM1_9BACI|nr:non-canonical purine NTP pyrophosphatase [Tepidibacillus fermentans]TCS84188.1 dITPase [Tepidibacillus fermentans]